MGIGYLRINLIVSHLTWKQLLKNYRFRKKTSEAVQKTCHKKMGEMDWKVWWVVKKTIKLIVLSDQIDRLLSQFYINVEIDLEQKQLPWLNQTQLLYNP